MGRTNHPELTVIFLLIAVMWSEAEVEIVVYCPSKSLNWNNARTYCREKYIDMLTGNLVDTDLMDLFLVESSYPLWIGLHEDPGQPSTWKWVNVK